MPEHINLDTMFDGIRRAWWSPPETFHQDLFLGFDGLREILAHQIARAFALPPQLVCAVDPEEKDEAATQPLVEAPRMPLTALVLAENGWATNGYFLIKRTNLDTYHVFILRSYQYCASNIKDDLQGWLQDWYHENLKDNFSAYCDPEFAALYDVTLPVWYAREAPW